DSIVLFLPCRVGHLNLYSFPTRRSSDLKKIILHIPHSSTNIPLSEGYLVDFITLEKEILKLTDWYTDDLFYSKDDEMIVAEFSRDRKSTRLNSSHVKISYAVFCLKKKKD